MNAAIFHTIITQLLYKISHPKCLDLYIHIKLFWKEHKYESQRDVFGNKINK